jgi:phenylacetate-CoA ligase
VYLRSGSPRLPTPNLESPSTRFFYSLDEQLGHGTTVMYSGTPSDVMHLPLDRLAALSLRRLKDSRTLERAAKSVLYREKWKAVGIVAEEITTYDDFARIPYITGQDLRKAMKEYSIEDVLCSNAVIHWFSSTGTTGTSKWIPYGRKDIELFLEIRDRFYGYIPPLEGVKCLAVSTPAPFAENGISAFERIRGMMTDAQREGVDICFTRGDDEDAFKFALDMKPNFIAAWPSFAARFAEMITERAPEVARQELHKRRSLRNLAVYFITRVKKIRPKDLSPYKWGLFGGESLDPYRKILRNDYGLEPYEFYQFTEFMCPAVECNVHDGMHLCVDACVAEIIPEHELERESQNPDHTPKAIPLWKAEAGLRGEYVTTSFGEALPLIRYRTGDLIRLVSTEPCQCGITHPRIKVPRRSDTTVCLGAIRFPAERLEEKLLATTPYGKAQRWQLRIAREGYRQKLLIRVEPCGEITDRVSFTEEISRRLGELAILKTGVENRVILEPVVILEERISDEGRSITPQGQIIYEDED